ncbi:MFS transporter, partial [Candidatus Protofrankia californiensis]|uniref:MFS transporter n=1 Tax=Candidatus Protofrankia californiensis TaxID=1839754 RepID=UPI00104195FD
TLGSLLVQYLSWRWVFLVNVPICLLAALVGARVLRESRDENATGVPDPLGVVLMTVALGAAALGIVEGPQWGWDDPRVLGAFLTAAVGLPLFVIRTRHAARPAVDLSLFRVRSYSVANAGMLTFAMAFFAITLANIIFLQTVWHWSVLHSAVAVTPSPLLAGVTAPLAGALADRFSHRAVLVPGAVAFAAAMLLFATRVGSTPHYVTDWLPAAMLTGVGIGLTFTTLGSAAVASLPPSRFGVGSAINSSFRQLGAVLGVSMFVAVLGTPSAASALDAFHRVWYVMAAVATLSALLCAGIRNRPHQPQPQPARPSAVTVDS